jgi:hypothetical protein
MNRPDGVSLFTSGSLRHVPDELKKLKEAGVHDSIILAMVRAS